MAAAFSRGTCARSIAGKRLLSSWPSGDPFWHGVGGTLAQVLDRPEMRLLFPAPSCMTLARRAAWLGWRRSRTMGLHACPVQVVLGPALAEGRRVDLHPPLRDGAAPAALLSINRAGLGASRA